jgi:hypothetical protein
MLRALTRTLAAVPLPAVVLAACGNDDDDAAADAGDADVGVTAVDYRYEGLPASVPAGTRFELMNDSMAEVHELVTIRLPDDEVRPVEEIFQLPPEELDELLAAAPATVLIAAPGAKATAVVGDGTLDEAGRYAFGCFIPTGADPDEVLAAIEQFDPEAGEEPPEPDGGPPHIAQGMVAELVVR